MSNTFDKALLLLCVLFTSLRTVNSIYCYQCEGTDSEHPFECNEYLESDVDLVPVDCSTIHDAQYCIKYVGRNEGVALECFQCNSSSTMECGDGLMKLDGGILRQTSCDHVYDAQYCIKLTAPTIFYGGFIDTGDGLYSLGGISTKRYCSSLDLGNYCNYVQQPGDKLEYRTCIYTCGSDGCNAATSLSIPALLVCFAMLAKFFVL